MAVRTHHIRGEVMEHARVTVEQLERLYDELDGGDEEHCRVCVSDERGRRLSVYKTGLVVLTFPKTDDPEEGKRRYRPSLPRAEAISLWQAHAEGDDATVEAAEWREEEASPEKEASPGGPP